MTALSALVTFPRSLDAGLTNGLPPNEGRPIVVSGFEPLDLLQSIVMLLRQLRAGESKVGNQYKRVVTWEGNRAALAAIAEVFELRPYFEWRGLGFISQSALRLREKYARVGRGAAI